MGGRARGGGGGRAGAGVKQPSIQPVHVCSMETILINNSNHSLISTLS